MLIRVSGGTNAGIRTVKPKTIPWYCPNCSSISKYRVCLGCNTPKPEE